jgi:predicted RNA-binding Zn-ribbon protein involved in translation (DUF1610 family)
MQEERWRLFGPYTRYRLALYLGALALLFGFVLIKFVPPAAQPEPIIWGLLALTVIAWGYTFFVRCPHCGTSLLRSSKARVLTGKMHVCAKCGANL